MMTKAYEKAYFYGYTPHLPILTENCNSLGIEPIIIFGCRQKDAINSLELSPGISKFCINSLEDKDYLDLKIREKRSIGLSFGSPFIFKQKDIDDFKGELINSHGAPLPEYKGGGGFSWRILQRDKRGMILMHYVTTQIDEGNAVFKMPFEFSDNERTPNDLGERQLREEKEHLLPWLGKIFRGEIELREITSESTNCSKRSSYFPRLYTELHGYIDWSLEIRNLEAFILAFSDPHAGASTFLKGYKARIMDCIILEQCAMHPFLSGIIIHKTEDKITVACVGGTISIELNDIKIEGNAIPRVGDRFQTPIERLEKALATRAFFGAEGVKEIDYRKSQSQD